MRCLLLVLVCSASIASAQTEGASELTPSANPDSDADADAGADADADADADSDSDSDANTEQDACAATLTVGEDTYQACGSNVVRTRAGRVVGVMDLDVQPTDLFERDGEVWFAVGDRAARLGGYSPRPAVPQPPPAHAAPVPPPPREIPTAPDRPRFNGPADLDPHGRYRDRIAPERVPGVSMGLSVMPVLGSGFAIMGDAFVAVRARRAFSARLIIDRIGHTLSVEDGDPEFGVFDGSLVLGYDHRYFEMSFGVGLTRARIDDFTRRLNGIAPTFVMGMRFGALDGLHVEVSSSLVASDGETDFSKIAVRMQWPLSVGRWLVVRGSGSGPSGYGWGEIGLRILTRGQRGSGSLFITPSIGGGGLFNDLTFARASGFAMSLGIEYRP